MNDRGGSADRMLAQIKLWNAETTSRQAHAMVEATGHTERDAIAILKALDAAGWVLVEKGR